jgi:hypothetical protein
MAGHLSALRNGCLGLVLSTVVPAMPSPAIAQQAQGVSDPVTSWGLAGLNDWNTAVPFLDIARLMRSFFAFTPGEWRSLSAGDLAKDGHLDSAGYPVRIPPGMAGVRTVWDWPEDFGAEQRVGPYILTYEGTGKIELSGAASITAEAPGRILFDNTTGGRFWLDITVTDPAGTGDYIRAISVVRAEHAALLEAGALFDPVWLEVIRDAREVRFMNWMETNGSLVVSWEDRGQLEDAQWSGDSGPPIEIMVRLANEAGVDPWFNMPHLADDNYVRQFATYVRDHLDPRLKAHVEYSNETWNGSFDQFDWLEEAALAEWGKDLAEDWGPIFDYHGMRATKAALIWEEVFGEASATRLINVMGTQTVNTWISDRLLTASTWAERDPGGYTPPSEVFEELAATSYFGSSFVRSGDLRDELVIRSRENHDQTNEWMYERVARDVEASDAIPEILAKLAEQQAIAEKHGLRLVLYEGGQHVHHSFAVRDLAEDQVETLQEVLSGFVRSPQMGALYAQLWDGWTAIGEGPFMQYVEMTAPSRWGSWGLLSHKDDTNPRAEFLLARQANGGSWWGEGGGPQYLQGIIAQGTEGTDRLTGTDEEDYLIGLGGDDIIVASPGNDGVNGGGGTDTYVLPGAADDHSVAVEGRGYRVNGPMGSAYLVNIETLEFESGATRELQ